MRDANGLSDLEREFELDMESDAEMAGLDVEGEDIADELELDDRDEHEREFAPDDDHESGGFDGDPAERLFELSQREFESPDESREALEAIMHEIYEDQFLGLGSVKKFIKDKGRKLIKQGVKLAARHPAFGLVKSVLAGNNLRQLLTTAAQGALASSPIGAVALPGLKALGFLPGAPPAEQREAWDNFVSVCREAYSDLAENLNEASDDPIQASRMATTSFQRGMEAVRHKARRASAGRGREGSQTTKVIRLRPGQRIVIVCR